MSKEQKEDKQFLTEQIIKALEKIDNIDYIRSIYAFAKCLSE